MAKRGTAGPATIKFANAIRVRLFKMESVVEVGSRRYALLPLKWRGRDLVGMRIRIGRTVARMIDAGWRNRSWFDMAVAKAWKSKFQ